MFPLCRQSCTCLSAAIATRANAGVTYFERGVILAHVIQPVLRESFSISYMALWQYESWISFMFWLVGEQVIESTITENYVDTRWSN